MRDPADGARNGEHHREHRARYAECAVDDARIEIYVRVQLARDEVFVPEGDLLEAQRQLKQRAVIAAELSENFVTGLADELGAWIEVLVDAMTEAHESEMAALVLGRREIFRDVIVRADLLAHRARRLVGALMRRAAERCDTGRDRRIGI